MPNWDLCEGCPIQGEYEPMEPCGDPDAPYLIVTDVPSENCAKHGVALPPGHRKKLMNHMSDSGIHEDDFHYHPICLCPYNKDQYTNKTKKHIHTHCRPHLEDYVTETQPQAILPLGVEGATCVFNRPTKITKVRGLAHPSLEFGVPVFPLMQPSLAIRYEQNDAVLAADCRSFGRLVDADLDIEVADSVIHGEYEWVEDLQFLIDMDPEIVAFDLEGTGLRWYQQGVDVRTYNPELHKGQDWFRPRAQILTMQFCTEEGKSYVLPWDLPDRPIPEHLKPKLRNQIRKLLCKRDRIVIGQNLKFDCVYLWMVEGIRFRIGGDTQMLQAIHDENLPEKNLDMLVKLHAPAMAGYADRFNSVINKSRMWEVLADDMLPYAAGDTDAVMRVYNVLEDLVAADPQLWNHYCNVSIPGLNAFAAIETRGMYVDDTGVLEEFQAYMETEVTQQKASLLRQVPRPIKRMHLELPSQRGKTAEEVLSFSRTAFLADILFKHPDGFRLKPVVWTDSTEKLPDELKEPSTSSKKHLPFFFDHCPFTLELAQHIKDSRLLGTNVIGFRNKFVVDGKVRPTYGLAKTDTRRSNSADPNGQNFPKRGAKAKMYQRIFKAPDGRYVISRDLSQAEIRIAGEMARDKVITKIYQEDGDIHVSTACIVLGVTEAQFKELPKDQQKDARQKAKAVNFGFLYGMGWRKFISYAKTDYGVVFTEKEARRIRDAYFAKYSGIGNWHTQTKKFAHKHGYVRSFSGLVRHLPMINSRDEMVAAQAERQAINSPVQEFGSTLGVIALGRMDEEVDGRYLELIGFIHDAIYAYVDEEYLEWGLKTLGYYMESSPIKEWFGHDMAIPIKSDPSFGLNMGDVFELEGFPRDDTPYDWNHKCLKDKEGNLLIEVPPQKIPPNNGRVTRDVYTLDTDLEDENPPPPPPIGRRTRLHTKAAQTRITRTRRAA